MWHLKAKTIRVVVGTLGLIKKGTNAFIEKVPGSPSLQEVQKIVLNSTTLIVMLRRALSFRLLSSPFIFYFLLYEKRHLQSP